MVAPETTSGMSALGRLTWMVLGPLVLVLVTFSIVREGGGWLTGFDIAFFFVLAVTLLGRWLEFRGGNPQTSTGEPATPADLRHYLIWGSAAGLAIYVLANLLGNHWLVR